MNANRSREGKEKRWPKSLNSRDVESRGGPTITGKGLFDLGYAAAKTIRAKLELSGECQRTPGSQIPQARNTTLLLKKIE